MYTYDNEEKKGNKNIILISIIILLAIALGVTLFLHFQKKKELTKALTSTSTELEESKNRLNQISNELDMKIEEIKKLGGDVEELMEAKEQVEKEKENLRRTNRVQMTDLREKISGFEILLKEQDSEIARLKDVNQVLLSENTTLKDQQINLSDSISQLSQTNEGLTEKVQVASRLKAEGIRIYAVNSRGKEKEEEFKGRQIERLKVLFNIAKNDVAPIEGKSIMVRIIDPENNVLFDVATGSGSFIYEGKEKFYTAKQDILFDNTGQELTFFYEKGSEYKPGKYNLEIYANDYVIGTKAFTVK